MKVNPRLGRRRTPPAPSGTRGLQVREEALCADLWAHLVACATSQGRGSCSFCQGSSSSFSSSFCGPCLRSTPALQVGGRDTERILVCLWAAFCPHSPQAPFQLFLPTACPAQPAEMLGLPQTQRQHPAIEFYPSSHNTLCKL